MQNPDHLVKTSYLQGFIHPNICVFKFLLFILETQQTSNKIPEPPFLRENLEKQITLLVDLLKQKLKKQGEG